MINRFRWAFAIALIAGLSAVVFACTAKPAAFAVPNGYATAQTKHQYPIVGEINRSYELGANAEVEVSAIEGNVKIETTNSNRAEVHWVRHARTQRDFDCETIDIRQSANNLTIEHRGDSGCRIIQAYEEMTLVVPQSANLIVGRIEGDLTIGKTVGHLDLRSIEGAVSVDDVRSAQIENVEGDVTLTVPQVESQGISIRHVEGRVMVHVAESVNANLRVQHVEGIVAVDLPNAPAVQRRRGNSYDDDDDGTSIRSYSMQLGSGGPSLLVSAVEGSVKVRRL